MLDFFYLPFINPLNVKIFSIIKGNVAVYLILNQSTNAFLKTTTTYFRCLVRLIKSLHSAPSLVLRKDISKSVKTCEGAKSNHR